MLEQELKSRSYRPGRYTCFVITDPKLREIWASDFRDRIIHHLLVNYLEPIWEKKFIFHSYACRKEKGSHKAIHYLKKAFKTQIYCNSPLYYLKIDIQSFFPSIDKNILFSLIQKSVKNPDILWLLKTIIFQDPAENFSVSGDNKLLSLIPWHKSLFSSGKDKGLPIGNLTSQFFANLYLNELDQFIKHHLKCRYYYRYMDDMVLLHTDKSQLLKWRDQISSFLENQLKLKLHPKKQILQPIKNGVDFLGYIIKPDYLLSRRRVVANLKQKLHYFNKLLNPNSNFKPDQEKNLTLPLLYANELPSFEFIEKAQATINSYCGHFKHANCFRLREKLYFDYFKELKFFLQPADKKFSHFIIRDSVKKIYRLNKKDC